MKYVPHEIFRAIMCPYGHIITVEDSFPSNKRDVFCSICKKTYLIFKHITKKGEAKFRIASSLADGRNERRS